MIDVDIEGTEKKVKQVDSLLTSLTNLLKKHWLILMFLTVLTGLYFIWSLPDEPVEAPRQNREGMVDEQSTQDSTATDNSTEEDVE